MSSASRRGRGGSRCPTSAERRRHCGDAAEGKEERCNTLSTFKTSKCNNSNIHLNADETLETWF
jgi:hypothetical protein